MTFLRIYACIIYSDFTCLQTRTRRHHMTLSISQANWRTTVSGSPSNPWIARNSSFVFKYKVVAKQFCKMVSKVFNVIDYLHLFLACWRPFAAAVPFGLHQRTTTAFLNNTLFNIQEQLLLPLPYAILFASKSKGLNEWMFIFHIVVRLDACFIRHRQHNNKERWK